MSDTFTYEPAPPVPYPAEDGTAALAPASPLAPDRYQTRIFDALEKENTNIDRAAASMEEESRLAEQRATALQPLRERQLDYLTRPLPELPKQQEPPPVPKRTPQDSKDAESWLFASGLLGALAGNFTRRHATNALAAFQGAMDGYAQGNKQAYDEKMKTWEAENKRVIEHNQLVLGHYRDILENRKLTMEQMSIELQVAASQYDDNAMAAAAKSKNSLTIAQLYDKQAKTLVDLENAGKRVSAGLAAQREAEWNRQALAYANSEEGIRRARAIAAGIEPMPPTTQRVGLEAAMSRHLMDKVRIVSQQELGRDFDASVFGRHQIETKTPALVERQNALIPGREEAAFQTSGARSLGTRLANMENVAYKLTSVVPKALAASDAVDRGGWTHFNSLDQFVQRATSDEKLKAFQVQNIQLAELWARSMKPTGVLDVTLQTRALEALSTTESKGAYRTALAAIVSDIEGEFEATKAQRSHQPITIPQIPGAFIPPGQRPSGQPAELSDPLGIR